MNGLTSLSTTPAPTLTSGIRILSPPHQFKRNEASPVSDLSAAPILKIPMRISIADLVDKNDSEHIQYPIANSDIGKNPTPNSDISTKITQDTEISAAHSHETFFGFVKEPIDAILLVEACIRGHLLSMDKHRVEPSETLPIRSGSVIVFEESARRWRNLAKRNQRTSLMLASQVLNQRTA
ncbi:hypothetical protein HK100_006231 [Physocladia obscura]|uniref:Uncharacterized protein n=1 Tax=Physocladia obscura TaxID=109957 RepID=A0AAD5TAA4_9FUNG|nr:hypothetical protein HK100_006231 [Physocladia obscura]